MRTEPKRSGAGGSRAGARGLREHVAPPRDSAAQQRHELRVLELDPREHAGRARGERALPRLLVVGVGREIHDRRKVGALAQVLEPLEAAPALHFLVEQHGVVGDAGEARPQAAARGGLVFRRQRIRPLERDVVGEQLAVVRPVADDQDLERHLVSRLAAQGAADDLERAAPGARGIALRLGQVGALRLQAGEVLGRDVAGDVLAREAGRVELGDLRVVVAHRAHEVRRGPGRSASRRR